jgi:hypothetical protein
MSGAQSTPAQPAPATGAEQSAPALTPGPAASAPGPPAAGPPAPRWHFLFKPKWLGWHAFAVVAVLGMLWLGDWQFHRAEAGNGLSWAYTFEWPIFAVMGIVFWAKTILDEFKAPGVTDSDAEEVDLPAAAGTLGLARSAALAVRDEDDPELAAYNAYLARLSEEVQGHGKWHGLR